ASNPSAIGGRKSRERSPLKRFLSPDGSAATFGGGSRNARAVRASRAPMSTRSLSGRTTTTPAPAIRALSAPTSRETRASCAFHIVAQFLVSYGRLARRNIGSNHL